MQTLKQEAIEAISRLPETASVDEMMYELYVIDKIKKGNRRVAGHRLQSRQQRARGLGRRSGRRH